MGSASKGLIEQLRVEVSERRLTKHPFYEAWSRGELPIEALRGYAKQYFHLVSSFPTYVSAVYANCPHPEVRQRILGNLADEEAHVGLWLRFCEALGLKGEEVTCSEALPETEGLLSELKLMTASRAFLVGATALFAYECQLPEISRRKMEGLRKFYKVSDEGPLEFFRVHNEVDERHSEVWRQVIENFTTSWYLRGRVEQAAQETLNALWLMLDGVCKAYLTNA